MHLPENLKLIQITPSTKFFFLFFYVSFSEQTTEASMRLAKGRLNFKAE